MKKSAVILLSMFLLVSLLYGCASEPPLPPTSPPPTNIEGNLEDILERIYEGLSDDIRLPMLMTTELAEDMGVADDGRRITYFIGASDIPFTEGIASEAAIGGAYSVCLLRMEEQADIDKAMKDIEEHIDHAKWICYIADTVIVDHIGDLIVLIMTNDENAPGLGKALHESFLELKV